METVFDANNGMDLYVLDRREERFSSTCTREQHWCRYHSGAAAANSQVYSYGFVTMSHRHRITTAVRYHLKNGMELLKILAHLSK